ncbi:MAG: bifunctional (p)ppGpp synthetase/guanosine-3',5'-bis(diphosphate) 3'-pyrophosphohydrolase [Firmicutes bacterium]|nr:bifunctional (p)ppGpp synthetase/guanosine-3',5'-bis(diphosphate) 3'-pyrophosphohydrolase [Bacillota bacterium]
MNLDKIHASLAEYAPGYDADLVQRAWNLAQRAHEGQFRESGLPFVVHPLAVAEILTEMEQDPETIAAAFLHDVVEDADVSVEEIKADFGAEIAQLVDGVTKLKRLRFQSKEQQQVENLRKMFMAMARDFRVIIIKFADRLHNMRTLSHMPPTRQKDIARETMEIYAPLAHRLGIFKFKWELEDLSFRYLHPQQYYQLAREIQQRREEREQLINEISFKISDSLQTAGLKAEITGRPKHLYSIWRKMQVQNKTLNEIFDLTALRVVVDNVRDCYTVLGHIHNLYKPVPGRFKDYIAMPKSNMYQSLHTTVIGPQGVPVEIQIRTWQMHHTSEYGLASHWRYKEGNRKGDRQFEQKLSWLRQFMEWQVELKDTNEYIETLKIDLFDDEVFVFTPKGDVIDLPMGAVPLDFAYRIHTDIGNKTVGAKVNGKLVPLDHKLQTGDIVEIVTQKGASPSRDWLKLVKSSQARTKIRQWFKRAGREQNIEKGRELLARELKRYNLNLSDITERFDQLIKRYNYNPKQGDDFFAALGYGGLNVASVGRKLYQLTLKERAEEVRLADLDEVREQRDTGRQDQNVVIKGADNLLIRFSRCCKPVPGDKIVGYVTRGRGVSVHRVDCPSIRGAQKERLLEVSWGEAENQAFPVELIIVAWDRKGLLQEIMHIFGEAKANILAIHGSGQNDGSARVNLTVEVSSLEHLRTISERLKSLRSVMEVRRRQHK